MPSIISSSKTQKPVSAIDFLKTFAAEQPAEGIFPVRARIKSILPAGVVGGAPKPAPTGAKSNRAATQASSKGKAFVAKSLKAVLNSTLDILADRLHQPVDGRRPLVVPTQATPAPQPQPNPETPKLSSFELRSQQIEDFMMTKAYAALNNSGKLVAQASVDFWKTMRNRYVEAVDRVGNHLVKGATHAI